jgi:hypothetical protein
VLYPTLINGLPGSIGVDQNRIRLVLAFGIRENRIQSLFIITNPDKLRHLSKFTQKS